MSVWEMRDEKGWQVELMFDFVEGSNSPLVLFVYDDSLLSLVLKFDALVREDLARHWTLQQCAEIEGFSPPRTNRPPRPG